MSHYNRPKCYRLVNVREVQRPIEVPQGNPFLDPFQETRLDTLLSVILNIMFPVKMLLRVYSLCILMIDLSWVVVNAVFAVIQATYEVFRPPPMKSLSMETALVCFFLLKLLTDLSNETEADHFFIK